MPATSQSQFRFMQAVAHGNAKNKPKGLSQSEAKEFVKGQSPKGLPEKVGKGADVAKGKNPDPKRDAMEKAKGLPDRDPPRTAALEKKLGVGGDKKVGKGAGMMGGLTPGKTFGANRRQPIPRVGPALRKPPTVGYGQDSGTKKGGVAQTYASTYLGGRKKAD